MRLNARALPVLAAIALVMQVLDPSRVWMILLIGFGGTWLVCRWWVRGLAGSLRLEREMRFDWAQVGDRIEERFTLTNRFMLPATWVAVYDESTLPDHHASIATGVDASSTSRWRILTQCTRRGVYRLGGTKLETGDPLGIYTLTLTDPASQTIAVMPPVLSLPRFEITSSGWAGEGRSTRRSLEETIQASQTREMAPNDPLRLIHWKTTARQARRGPDGADKFFVRQFEGTPAGDWWIVLDLHADSQVGAGWDSTEEHAVILAASLAAQGLSDDHPVGISINGSEPGWLPPRRNEFQMRSLLKALAFASPGELPLKAYLERMGAALAGSCSLILITACVEPGWVPGLLPLMWRGIRPTVFLLDPVSFGGSVPTSAVEHALRLMNVRFHVIPRAVLDRPAARPGHEGEWEWRISATGKAIPVRVPQAEWREL